MAAESETYRMLKPFVVLGTVTLVVVILSWAKVVFVPLALAILFAFILTPPVVWLRRHGFGRWPAALVVTGLALVLVVGAGWIMSLQVRALIKDLPKHSDNIATKIARLNEGDSGFKQVAKMVHDLGVQYQQNAAAPAIEGGEKPVPVQIVDNNPFAFGLVPSLAEPILEIVVGIILVLVLVVFMLVSREDLQYRLIQLVGHGHMTATTHAMYEAAERTSKFLLTQSMINTMFGALVALGLFVLPVEGLLGYLPEGTERHVPYALLWGFLAGLLRFVPYAGTWVALLFPLALATAVFPTWWPLLEILIYYILLELTIANFIEPLLLSHSTGISPIALLLAAAFWTWLWGPIGLVLATPLTVCLSVLGRHMPALSFLHTVLGSEPVLDLPNRFYQRLLSQDPDEATVIIEEIMQKEPPETVYDRVLIPALVMLRRDTQRGEMNDEIAADSLETIGELLEELVPAMQAVAPTPTTAAGVEAKEKVCVLGCSTGDRIDELALQMFRQLVEASGYKMTLASSVKLSAEVVTMVEEQKPSVVCIASLPPGGVARASYLCKRLRAKMPELQILVGRWGQEDMVQARQRLQAAGANEVSNSLLDMRKLLIPLLQHYSTCAVPTPEAKPPEAKREPAVTR